MRRLMLMLVLVGTLVGGAVWLRGESASPANNLIATPVSNQSSTSHYLGVSSCAGGACHGAQVSSAAQQGMAWNSSYTVWAGHDKHAEAYSDLFSERSRQMVQLLRGLDRIDDAKPYEEQRCLACHSIGAGSGQGISFSEGVSCEACHGPASQWLKPHTTSTFKGRNAQQQAELAELGMINTKDLTTRAQQCVKCHIGAPADQSSPLRDMNHDMIAAGHPRLNFEFGAYLANMPPHWDAQADRARTSEFETQAWAIGQVASAIAALNLLEARAHDAQVPLTAEMSESNHAIPRGAWPEFAEYDCYACHHDMRADDRPGTGHRLGAVAWGTSFLPLTRALAQRHGVEEAGLTQLTSIIDEIERPWPDPAKIEQRTIACRDNELTPLLNQVRGSKYSPAETTRLAHDMANAYRQKKPASWDEWAQFYFACSALQSARTKSAAGAQPTASDARIAQVLEAIRNKKLGFPPQYDSPRKFDPADKGLATDCDLLLNLLNSSDP